MEISHSADVIADVIIIGGSYAGLSAAMALGRSLRTVVIIDSGKPCNRQTPHSHNFITQDGETPLSIFSKAKTQVLVYPTVQFFGELALDGKKTNDRFEIRTDAGHIFTGKKVLFATGVTDIPHIQGIAECWGISVLHCPYCHGYEVRNQHIGIIGNGDMGFDLVRLLRNWTTHLTLFTNGISTLTHHQRDKLQSHQIDIIEKEISSLAHTNGQVESLQFSDNTTHDRINAVFTRLPFQQHCMIPQELGCEMTEQGFIKTDMMQKTSLHGVYAAGDNTTMMRSVSAAVAAGTVAGAAINREMIEEEL
jgi:thioredoxin reductase